LERVPTPRRGYYSCTSLAVRWFNPNSLAYFLDPPRNRSELCKDFFKLRKALLAVLAKKRYSQPVLIFAY
jgi:hypothetical protein